ncbi:MAG: hypothetical protein RBT74_08245 [Tenuifilaceae bacterium]|jgi:hypothetical protein|nr:hypothetical protein [Tenuifilaceae bacterium]
MRRIYLVITFSVICLTFNNLYATGIINRKVNISLGVYEVIDERPGTGINPDGTEYSIPLPTAAFYIKACYKVFKNFDAGGYTAYSVMSHKVSQESEMYMRSKTIFYGLSFTYDILPIITGKDNLRFKLMTTSNIGLVSARWTEEKNNDWIKFWNKPFTEFGIGCNASFYFTRRIGLTLGYSAGRFYNNGKSRLNAGLEFKF